MPHRSSMTRWMIVAATGSVVILVLMLAISFHAMRSGGYWTLSVANRDDGMVMRVGTTASKVEVYRVVVPEYKASREFDSLVLGRKGTVYPVGVTPLFEDTTVLPGRCQLRVGPVLLDLMPMGATANGVGLHWGEVVTINVPAAQGAVGKTTVTTSREPPEAGGPVKQLPRWTPLRGFTVLMLLAIALAIGIELPRLRSLRASYLQTAKEHEEAARSAADLLRKAGACLSLSDAMEPGAKMADDEALVAMLEAGGSDLIRSWARLQAYHAGLVKKYQRAARCPWLPLAPDPHPPT